MDALIRFIGMISPLPMVAEQILEEAQAGIARRGLAIPTPPTEPPLLDNLRSVLDFVRMVSPLPMVGESLVGAARDAIAARDPTAEPPSAPPRGAGGGGGGDVGWVVMLGIAAVIAASQEQHG